MNHPRRSLIGSCAVVACTVLTLQASPVACAQEHADLRSMPMSPAALRHAGFDEDRRREAVADLYAAWRPSLMIDNTWVLMVQNPSGLTADFVLRCFDNRGHSATFPIAIVAGRGTEVGALQGWDGNFVPGEFCVAYYDGDPVWQIRR